MLGWRPLPATAVTAVLLLWVFSFLSLAIVVVLCKGNHGEARIDFANMTALQKHAEFFDRDKDGIITPSEMFEGGSAREASQSPGYVAIGCDAEYARATAASVSAGVGAITSPVDAPLPHLSISIYDSPAAPRNLRWSTTVKIFLTV
ncbi:probable peroxygenase 7 [Panicum virgatum]|uniref:probable peroxygenase 7 n=1 Tax=Panicum virgatum TaxID=38727 RepID=UPI0019D6A8E1|nr:probable peroxygenase 7 [Panicum virgatum]